MQGPGLVIIAILLMVVLNVLMVIATMAVKILRTVERRRVENLRELLEPALYDYLVTGEISPVLRQTKARDKNILSNMIIELLTVLRGSESKRVMELAGELGFIEGDLAQLNSRNRWRRAKAAENLGFYGGPESVGPISGLLKEMDETIRAVASRALSRIGTQEAAEALAGYLSSDSELTSLRMAENLERMGPLAVEPLVELVESDEEEERRAQVLAARVLGNLRIQEGRPALCQAIERHWNTDLRAQATLALGRIGNPDDVPAIVEAAGDNSWPVKVQAANALGMIGEVSTVPTLEQLVTDQEWWVRLNASRALINIGPEGEKALVRLLENPDRYARDRAIATLEEQGIVRRMAGELAEGNAGAEYAAQVIKSLVRAGSTRHLDRLSRTLPKKKERQALGEVLAEAKAEIETEPDDA
ncbi:MAG: HEAT repeat domain-containing protein [Rubrobacteraceae bacterium]